LAELLALLIGYALSALLQRRRRRRADLPGREVSVGGDFRRLRDTVRVRIIGDRERFPSSGPYARSYTVLHLRGAKHWPTSFPINYQNGRWCTILINRKPPHLPGD
jgi:hypothetical protein